MAMTHRRITRLAAAAAALACAAGGARAGVIQVLPPTVVTADAAQSAPAGIDPSLADPNGAFGGGLLESIPSIYAPFGGMLTVSVTDLGLVGDVYELLLDGSPLGITSPAPIGGPAPSSGTFTVAIGAGYHQLDLWDFIQTYLFDTSPYGGLVTGDYIDSDVRVSASVASVSVTPVPEPAALAVLPLAGFALLRRPRRAA